MITVISLKMRMIINWEWLLLLIDNWYHFDIKKNHFPTIQSTQGVKNRISSYYMRKKEKSNILTAVIKQSDKHIYIHMSITFLFPMELSLLTFLSVQVKIRKNNKSTVFLTCNKKNGVEKTRIRHIFIHSPIAVQITH